MSQEKESSIKIESQETTDKDTNAPPPQAYNEETGEINWDCPCLGNMTKPPCGEDFKAAFSCFVYSKEEPKGSDCVDLFRNMQDCFRRYPEIYGPDEEDEDEEEEASQNSNGTSSAKSD